MQHFHAMKNPQPLGNLLDYFSGLFNFRLGISCYPLPQRRPFEKFGDIIKAAFFPG